MRQEPGVESGASGSPDGAGGRDDAIGLALRQDCFGTAGEETAPRQKALRWPRKRWREPARRQQEAEGGIQHTRGGAPGLAAGLGVEVNGAGIGGLGFTWEMPVPLPEVGMSTRGTGLGWGINMPPTKEIWY